MAYEHWHRMLFSRFLEQSNLLMYEPGTHVSLDECFELAEEEEDCKDGWELAGRLAEKMLPQIFRADSPVFEANLSINHVNALEELIAALHPDTFQASDSLGWCYQFWQNKKKKQVNESGVKIGAKELSPVTQLFTEPYMVSFLLDNALGAWWAKRRLTKDDLQTANSEQELRDLAAIPGVPLEYLRFVQNEESGNWSSAAGDFDKWPEHLSELKTLDPCCGSGHFLVAKFLMLVPMRMQLEALTAKQAVDKVLSENIHGLELDQRCVELAAFALALEAWRYPGAGGYRQLPELQLACSGMSIVEAQKEWKDLAKGDEELQSAVKWMQETFKDAPTLGSLIDPTKNLGETDSKPWELIQQAVISQSNASIETIATAQGLAKAAVLLSYKYQWVVTNVPYLTRSKQSILLKGFCDKNYPASKNDLATVFLERCLDLCSEGGTSSIVLPQNWLFLPGYKKIREKLLSNDKWDFLARLGAGAFETISGEVVKAILITLSKGKARAEHFMHGTDVSNLKKATDKAKGLCTDEVKSVRQGKQLTNPDARVMLEEIDSSSLMNKQASSVQGLATSDDPQFTCSFWEVTRWAKEWVPLRGTVKDSIHFGGCERLLLWEEGEGKYFLHAMNLKAEGRLGGWKSGVEARNKKGIIISQMSHIPVSLYCGEFYDHNACVVVPNDSQTLSSLWCYLSSKSFNKEVRQIDQSLKPSNNTFLSIPFIQQEWSEVSNKRYPNGLPKEYTNDPTQWLFHGHPCSSVIWNEEIKTTSISGLRQDDTVLQVAIARLLGYRWPAELDAEMELAPVMREVIAKCKNFDGLVDDDGIVCIPAIRGEKPADDRLETILHVAYGDEWSATVLNNLLKSVKSTNLNTWLRDKFFEQHCSSKMFQHRPFIWQVWDGLTDGFSALVNYHTLDYKGLERLIYTYLDDWISTQVQLEKDGVEGAELRLSAARNLKESLEAILVGDSLPGQGGLDIFVRWKSLAEQPIGWNPDLNDGVRLNIRPFMQAKDVGKKEAGVLRFKPNIHWKKDRGTDVASAPWFDLGLEYGGKQGDRINDHHLTLAEKKAARDAK
jgi:hypothetical protein